MKTNWLDTQLLEDYLDGKLDAKAMHFVEREALEDPFVAEALEGLSKSRNRTQSISILQRQLHERIAQKPVQRKLWGLTTHRLSIAAAAAVLFVSASLIYWMVESQKRMAAEKGGKVVDVEVMASAPAPATAPATDQSGVNSPESIVLSPKSRVGSLKSKVEPSAQDLGLRTRDLRLAKAAPPRPEVSARYSKSSISGFESAGISTAADAQPAAAAVARVAEFGKRPTITGVVIGQDNLPIPGVAISSGTGKSLTVTDDEGRYVVDSALAGSSLKAVRLGMIAQTKTVPTSKITNFTLVPESQTLSTVVVTGMGRSTQAKAVPYSVGKIPPGYFGKVVNKSNDEAVADATLTRQFDGAVYKVLNDGGFTIQVANDTSHVFVVKAKGYKDQKITLEAGKMIKVQLEKL